ncbi:hypothetical protein T484DRAFT_1774146 [Baffinella frigidus]|nr:hypothetical protein T484DRAFT_1774146 [Cryptophyta sp. CCMP2293]
MSSSVALLLLLAAAAQINALPQPTSSAGTLLTPGLLQQHSLRAREPEPVSEETQYPLFGGHSYAARAAEILVACSGLFFLVPLITEILKRIAAETG